MKQKHKKYSKPKRPFDKTRIDEEAEIRKNFGLKNKKEIWKAEAKVKSIREKAKRLISADPEKQQALFEKLKKMGLKVDSIADILALDKADYLKRRLQSILVEKKLATTSKSARQLITHKKVLVDGKVVGSPSYIVTTELEDKISLKNEKPKKVVETAQESVPEEEKAEVAEGKEEVKEEIKEEGKEQ